MVTITANPSQTEMIVNRARNIGLLIAGIHAVSPTTPQNSYVFPALILNAGKAQIRGHTDHDNVTRDITLMLLTGPAEAKFQMQLEAATIPLIDAIQQAFIKRRALELNDNGLVERAYISGDTGAQTLTYLGSQYVGSIITLTVIYNVMEI